MATINKGRPRKDGSVPWVVFYVDQDGEDHIKTFDTQRDAKKFKRKTEQEVGDRTHVPDRKSITFGRACDKYVEWQESQGRQEGTLERTSQQIRMYIKPLKNEAGKPLGEQVLSRLTHDDAKDYTDQLGKTAPRYVASRALRLIKAIVRHMQGDHVKMNVFAECKLPGKIRSRSSHEIDDGTPTEAELNKLLDNATGRLYALIVVAAYTGLRTGELRALIWDQHIDFECSLIYVRKSVKAWTKKSRRWIGKLKTETSERDQPMPPECVKALKEWRLQCPRASTSLHGFHTTEEKAMQIAQYIRDHDDVGEDTKKYQVSKIFQKDLMKRFGVAGDTIIAIRRALRAGHPFTPTGKLKYVFPSKFGGILHSTTFEVYFKRLQVRLGIVGEDGKAKYSPHSLRHFYASYLIKKGATVVQVQHLMGHGSPDITLRQYSHLFDSREEQAALVDRTFGSLRQKSPEIRHEVIEL